MTSADKLNNLRQRWKSLMSVSRIDADDLLTRGLYWKQERWLQESILDGLGRDPSHERDIADDARCDAARKHRAIIERMWSERRAAGYVERAVA